MIRTNTDVRFKVGVLVSRIVFVALDVKLGASNDEIRALPKTSSTKYSVRLFSGGGLAYNLVRFEAGSIIGTRFAQGHLAYGLLKEYITNLVDDYVADPSINV